MSTSTLVIDSVTTDFLACNSGTCTGSFSANALAANSAAVTGQITAGSVQVNSGAFLTSLTISGVPVVTADHVGISALADDAAPTLSANLNANSKSIINLDSVIANSASFALNVGADSFTGNTISLAGAGSMASLNANSIAVTGNVGAGSVSVNSGSFAVGLTAGGVTANNGAFASSLTISGVPVAKANVPAQRIYMSLHPATVTNMSSTLNFYTNAADRVQLADLTNMNEVRFTATQLVAGATNARMRLNYATSFQTSASSYDKVLSTAGTNGGVELNVSTANGVRDSGWLPLRSEAKGNVYLAVVISGGDGAADPSFGALVAEFR